jgi:hypothetical protein
MALYFPREVIMEYEEFIMSGIGGIATIMEEYLIERDGE